MPTLLNESNIKQAHDLAEYDKNDTFNCWGATLFALGKLEELEWLDCQYMTEFLENETEKINQSNIKIGDILAMYYGGELVHTAVYVGNMHFWHKCGASLSYYEKIDDVLETYSYTEFLILRLKK